MADRITAHEQGADLVLNYHQDVEPHLELAAAARREEREHSTIKAGFRRKMIVPFNVLLKIKNETGLDFLNPEDSKAIFKLLKSSEYAMFRTVNDKRL